MTDFNNVNIIATGEFTASALDLMNDLRVLSTSITEWTASAGKINYFHVGSWYFSASFSQSAAAPLSYNQNLSSCSHILELKKDLSKKPYVENRITFMGKQKNVREFLDISEIYVQPTLNQGRMEGAPIAIQEAMANGKIIIGSNIPGVRDQLKLFPDHLFNAGDVTELRDKLNRFMSNKSSANNKIGNKFVHHVKKFYDLSLETKNLEAFYKDIIS